jgi:hypothetical protein
MLTCHERYKIALFCGLSPPLDKSRTVVTVRDSHRKVFVAAFVFVPVRHGERRKVDMNPWERRWYYSIL